MILLQEREGLRLLKRNSINDPIDAQVYDKLERYFVDLINSFSKDGKNPLVFSEIKIYDPKLKEAGTIDLLIVEEDGKTHIIDWKFMDIDKNMSKDVPWFKQGAFDIQLGRYRDILVDYYDVKRWG